MTSILETQHLKLREFGQGDLNDLAAMVADEDQMRFYPRPKTRDEASAWISRNLVLYKEYGFGFWFIESLSPAAAAKASRILMEAFNGGAVEPALSLYTTAPGTSIEGLRDDRP